MASYLPWHGKKRAGFARAETRLLRLLVRGDDGPGLVLVAEELRIARVRALRSELARVPPCGRGDNDERVRRLSERIARCSV